MVFWENTLVFWANSVAFWANTMVFFWQIQWHFWQIPCFFLPNRVVFWASTMVFWENTALGILNHTLKSRTQTSKQWLGRSSRLNAPWSQALGASLKKRRGQLTTPGESSLFVKPISVSDKRNRMTKANLLVRISWANRGVVVTPLTHLVLAQPPKRSRRVWGSQHRQKPLHC